MGGAHTPRASSQTAVEAPILTSGVERDLGKWKQFLGAEDRRCEEHHLAAALVTIGLHDERALDSLISALQGVLRPTDRIGVLCPDELSVLLVPLDDIHHAQRMVQQIDATLRTAKIGAHIGWAMRLDGHGIFHSSARADAAMLTAKGHGRLDLSKR